MILLLPVPVERYVMRGVKCFLFLIRINTMMLLMKSSRPFGMFVFLLS